MVLEKQRMYADSHADTLTSGMGIGQIYSIAMFLLKKSPTKVGPFVVLKNRERKLILTQTRGGGLGSSTIFKNLMSPTPRRKWYFNDEA